MILPCYNQAKAVFSRGRIFTSTLHTSKQIMAKSKDSEKVRTPPRRTSSSYKKKTNQIGSKTPNTENTLTGGITSTPWYNVFTKGDERYNAYMANEWGYEKHGDQALFEKLCLEGAQSGLSWRTILNKRDAYRKAFHNFDIGKVANMTSNDIDQILNSGKTGDEMIVKHRGKIESVINNAKKLQDLLPMVNAEGYKDFSDWLWSFVNHQPVLNSWKTLSDMPSKTDESEAMSKALKKNGFKFVGPTTCYSLMQSCGFVIDHPLGTKEWKASFNRLKKRKEGFQDRRNN